MSVSSVKPEILCFGSFELDLQNSQLRQQGKLVHLQEQPLQLLALLLQRPGVLVDREEIRQNLWPQHTFVEFDDSVNHAIRKVRDALGDSATNPRFVETVPRQGYRFIAPVRVLSTGNNSDSAPSAMRILRFHWVGWLTLGAGLAAGAFFLRRSLPQTPHVRSLAVLPLENLSGDPAQEYFSDGVTEAIITDLGKMRGIRVISRTSVMRFKRASKALPEIARDLGVDALVEGGVVRSGGRVRITAQLVAVNPERHVWAASYEQDAANIIDLRREVAEAVAGEIRATLSGSPPQPTNTVNPQAYELYLRGREHLNNFNTPGFFQAVEYLNQVIVLDPNYAPAHASLAVAYVQLGFLSGMPRDQASQQAKQAAARAVALDDGLAEAHTALAYAKFIFDWDWHSPDAQFRRALALNPNSADAHLVYSIYLTLCGRFDDAIRENQVAINLDPLNPFVNFNLGWIYFNARRYAEGILFIQELQRRYPDYPFSHHHLAVLYAEQGKCTEALAEADQEQGFDRAFAYAVCGQSERALKLLGDAENEVARGKLDPIYPAWMYASLGRRDEAFRWLDRAIEQRSVQVVFIRVMPELDGIRSDPRFASALRRAGVN